MKLNKLFISAILVAAAYTAIITGCGGGGVAAAGDTIYALDQDGKTFYKFNSTTPGTIASSVPVTGLGLGEWLVSFAFRPANGMLYGISNNSALYTIDTTTGAITPVGAFTPALTGVMVSMDFQPVVDRIRVVTDSGQDFRLDPDTATVFTDTDLAYSIGDAHEGSAPKMVAIAYSNKVPLPTSTTLYDLDSGMDSVATQGSVNGSPVSPNSGQLFTVGDLGFNTNDFVGMDFSKTGTLYVTLTALGGIQSELCTINIATGAMTPVGTVGSVTPPLRDIAVSP